MRTNNKSTGIALYCLILIKILLFTSLEVKASMGLLASPSVDEEEVKGTIYNTSVIFLRTIRILEEKRREKMLLGVIKTPSSCEQLTESQLDYKKTISMPQRYRQSSEKDVSKEIQSDSKSAPELNKGKSSTLKVSASKQRRKSANSKDLKTTSDILRTSESQESAVNRESRSITLLSMSETGLQGSYLKGARKTPDLGGELFFSRELNFEPQAPATYEHHQYKASLQKFLLQFLQFSGNTLIEAIKTESTPQGMAINFATAYTKQLAAIALHEGWPLAQTLGSKIYNVIKKRHEKKRYGSKHTEKIKEIHDNLQKLTSPQTSLSEDIPQEGLIADFIRSRRKQLEKLEQTISNSARKFSTDFSRNPYFVYGLIKGGKGANRFIELTNRGANLEITREDYNMFWDSETNSRRKLFLGEGNRPLEINEEPWILSIDGGGIRGILALAILAQIEAKTKKPIRDLVHFMTGASTGAAIVTALSLLQQDGKPRRAADIAEIYKANARKVFGDRNWLTLTRHSKYKPHNLKDLALALGVKEGMKISDLTNNIFIPYFDGTVMKLAFFDSMLARNDPESELNGGLVDINMSSCAAPSYFPPVAFKDCSKCAHLGIDAGMAANNPALLYYSYLLKIFGSSQNYSHKNFKVLSVDTGKASKTYGKEDFGGSLDWIHGRDGDMPLTNISIDGVAKKDSFILDNILDENHIRITTNIEKKLSQLDEFSPKKLERLYSLGVNRANDSDVQDVITQLMNTENQTRLQKLDKLIQDYQKKFR